MTQDDADGPTRPSVPAMDALLGKALPVLDHGFVRLVDYMGDDGAVVQAARVSYGKGTRTTREDEALIGYLMRHRHTTPFEMCEIKVHVKLPIFVARQWIRHRTASVNEYSARYSVLDREFYVPDAANLKPQSAANRQGREGSFTDAQYRELAGLFEGAGAQAYDLYEMLLADDEDAQRPGVARELARIGLGVNFYTQWYWKTDLHNFMNFLALRADPHAQYEIRAYADVLLKVLEAWVPATYAAFREHRLDGATLSRSEVDAVRAVLAGQDLAAASGFLKGRELREFLATFALDRDFGEL